MVQRSRKNINGSIAKHALVLYTEGTNGGLELWDIHQGELVNPRPISNKFIKDLYFIVKPFRPEEKAFSGPVPRETLWVDRTAMAFFKPAQTVKLRMEGGTDKKAVNVVAFMPASVILYKGPAHEIMILWSKGSFDDVASGASVLIGAELPNVDENGILCLGSAMSNVRFRESLTSMQKHCWNAILNSEFNEWRREETSACMKLMKKAANDPVEQRKLSVLNFGKAVNEKLSNRKWRTLNQAMMSFLGKDA